MVGPVLPFDIIDPMQYHPSQPLKILFVMFAGLFHVLSMFLPSRLLTLPKISENIEISINSPKTIKREWKTGTSDMPSAMSQGADESAADQEMLSSTASSRPDSLDSAAETEIPRSLTPDSSVESENSPSRRTILNLSGLWTEQSEKVRCAYTSFT